MKETAKQDYPLFPDSEGINRPSHPCLNAYVDKWMQLIDMNGVVHYTNASDEHWCAWHAWALNLEEITL